MTMRSELTIIATFALALTLAVGLATTTAAQDDQPPEPAPPEDPDQLLVLPDVADDIDAYLHLPPPRPAGGIRQLAASDRQACVLLQNGLVECWPIDETFDTFVAPPNELFAAIAVGRDHACGLDPTSRPICWGDNRYGQLDAPNEILLDIAAGDHHSCGIDVTGEIHCWGQLDAAHRNPPSGPFDKISAGADRTCVAGPWEPSRCFGGHTAPDEPFDEYVHLLETSSNVVCALDLSNRPICRLDPMPRPFEPPSPLAADIAVGSGFMCTLEPSGALRCAGPDAPALPPSPPISQIIDAGEQTLCAVTVLNELKCWDGDDSLFEDQ